ncbi:hypothetical protein [Blastococcus goldschmidtiae]|uniref:Uncharacterized protein n=1 Tax=Blastococcus goldschmidtiae TaxID=3075546 RepID=A0ABU2K936_9ACTN|nr:hypothetical protein [Blastococcus sp. DSM 46792]MDT0276709.1 hypothetical protein [Blastococcus sp. DSM 46792]
MTTCRAVARAIQRNEITIEQAEALLRDVTVTRHRMTWDEKMLGADGWWDDNDPQHLSVLQMMDIISLDEAQRLFRSMRRA